MKSRRVAWSVGRYCGVFAMEGEAKPFADGIQNRRVRDSIEIIEYDALIVMLQLIY
jgi:hypothetical protein